MKLTGEKAFRNKILAMEEYLDFIRVDGKLRMIKDSAFKRTNEIITADKNITLRHRYAKDGTTKGVILLTYYKINKNWRGTWLNYMNRVKLLNGKHKGKIVSVQ